MSIEFPTLVYRTPGTHQCPGGTYAYQSATDAEQLDALLEGGWFLSLPEALAGEHDQSRYEWGKKDDGAPAVVIVEQYQAVADWLIKQLAGYGVEMQDLEPIAHSNDELFAKAVYMAADELSEERLEGYKKAQGDIPQQWLLAKAKELDLNPDDALTADDLLLLICHAFAAKPEDAEEDNKPPTREELEAKAKELGITFDGRTTDKSLTEKIEHVLAEQSQE